MKRPLLLAVTAALLAAGLAACQPNTSTLDRPAQPMVLTGAQLPALTGVAPDRIVAFRHTRVGGTPAWTQIPVQIDERKVVAFGSQPPSNTTAGVTGTVYGHGSGGPTALQYADPSTFVGADTDPTFDANDELVFMVSDAGGQPKPEEPAHPAGVVAGSGVAVRIDDPQGGRGFVYLFRTTGGLDPAAGQDYVDYDFSLVSGDYRSTYKRADGPNPETSTVRTDRYVIGFSDRWYENSWRIAGGTGVDVLDGNKNQFAVGYCGRSNRTFNDAEGAFVANIDGPVRAIRSYVGANSGPLTQRTHVFYRDREVVITNLRVHSIPAIMDYLDMSSAAVGMTYRSSTRPGGVPVDGVADLISEAQPEWESWAGPQGTVFSRIRFSSSAPGLQEKLRWFTRDAVTTTEAQCWGDASYYGVGGAWVAGEIPNTDPRSAPFATFTGTRTNQFSAPSGDGAALNAAAQAWADDISAPLTTVISRHAAG